MSFPSGYDQSTATIKPWGMYAKATDLGAVSTDGLWHRYSLTATVPGANIASPNAPTQGRFYVQIEKTAGADNTNGAFWVADLSVKCVRADYLRDAPRRRQAPRRRFRAVSSSPRCSPSRRAEVSWWLA